MNMNEWWNTVLEWMTGERVLTIVGALTLVVLGFVVARLASVAFSRALTRYLDTHQRMIVRRGSYYAILALFLLSALHQLGINLSILLGAAGILSVAIGFASQTSASNLISGLFLIGERPFTVGDIITIEGTTGEVLSVDLLSVKLRTFDNLFVRIPNEKMLQSQVTNLTRFPIRRIDLKLGVAYKEDISKVRAVLDDIADQNPLCLQDPAPLFIFLGFGDSSLDIQYSIWGLKENFLELRNSIQQEIKEAFDREGIEIPFPHISVYTGSVTDPFPVRLDHGGQAPDTRGAQERE